jgi:hypothetical protein
VLARAIAEAREAGMLRVSHFLHLRCEVPMPNVVAEAAELIGRSDVRLLSQMDHTPGQRQFRDQQKLRDYYRGKNASVSDVQLDALFARRLEYQAAYAAENYRTLVALARDHAVPLASHDDTTLEHVEQAIKDRVAIAEVSDYCRSRTGVAPARVPSTDESAQCGARPLACRQFRHCGACGMLGWQRLAAHGSHVVLYALMCANFSHRSFMNGQIFVLRQQLLVHHTGHEGQDARPSVRRARDWRARSCAMV